MSYQALQVIHLVENGEVKDRTWNEIGHLCSSPKEVIELVQDLFDYDIPGGIYVRSFVGDYAVNLDFSRFCTDHNYNAEPGYVVYKKNFSEMHIEGDFCDLVLDEDNARCLDEELDRFIELEEKYGAGLLGYEIRFQTFRIVFDNHLMIDGPDTAALDLYDIDQIKVFRNAVNKCYMQVNYYRLEVGSLGKG